MPASNRDDWFVRSEIEVTNVEGMTPWYLGCNGSIVRPPECPRAVERVLTSDRITVREPGTGSFGTLGA